MRRCVEIVVRSVTIDREGTTVNVDDPIEAQRFLSFGVDRADALWWAGKIGKSVVLFTDDSLESE